MKKRNREFIVGLVALSLSLCFPGLSVVQSASAAPQKQPASTLKVPTVIDAGVARAEENLRLVTVRFNNGVGTPDDVSEAKIALADTRIRAALDRNEFIGLRQDLETIVTQRQSLLDQMNQRWIAGIATPTDVNTAEEALAEACSSGPIFCFAHPSSTAL